MEKLAQKIRRILENDGCYDLPCASMINRILDRNSSHQASLAAAPHRRFEALWSGEMWQVDYKGHFAMGDRRRYHSLNIIDNYSH